MLLTAVLIPAIEGGFVALNPETDTTTHGESVSEAIGNLREATELYLEEFPLEETGQALRTTFEVAAPCLDFRASRDQRLCAQYEGSDSRSHDSEEVTSSCGGDRLVA